MDPHRTVRSFHEKQRKQVNQNKQQTTSVSSGSTLIGAEGGISNHAVHNTPKQKCSPKRRSQNKRRNSQASNQEISYIPKEMDNQQVQDAHDMTTYMDLPYNVFEDWKEDRPTDRYSTSRNVVTDGCLSKVNEVD